VLQKTGLGIALFANLGLLASKRPQVIKLCPANIAAANNLNVVDYWGVQRESPLDTDLEADFSHNEGLGQTVTGACNNNTLENLDSGARAFNDVHVNFDGVTGAEIGNIGSQRCCVYEVKGLHNGVALCAATGRTQ